MKFIPNAVSVKVALTFLKAQKHSPKIMFGAGIAGVVATAVVASKATLKAEIILAEHQVYKSDIESIVLGDSYSAEDRTKDKALLAYQTSLKIAKLYAPAVIIGVGSIGLLTGSHIMLTRRNAALTAAYAALDKVFDEYRGRVRNDVGEDRERELYRDIRSEKVTVTDENGKKKQVVKKKAHGGGKYAYFWTEILADAEGGEMNPNWHDLPEMRTLWLRNMEKQFNNQLRSNGHLFLGDVLKEMHIPRTGEFGKRAQAVGWLYDKNDETRYGDGYVSFGIFSDQKMGELLDFTVGREDGIWLDFNVDGNILDLI